MFTHRQLLDQEDIQSEGSAVLFGDLSPNGRGETSKRRPLKMSCQEHCALATSSVSKKGVRMYVMSVDSRTGRL